MIVFLHFLLNLKETLRCSSAPHGFFMFMFLTTISKGSTCEAPSSPQCFRQNVQESVYICEWGFDTNESDVTFDLYFNDSTVIERKCEKVREKRCEIPEEWLIVGNNVDFWVEANVGNCSCTSTRQTSILENTVKYKAPQNISLSWLRNNLSLRWPAAEENPSLADVWFRRYEHPTESWEKMSKNTTYEASMYEIIIENLLRHSVYQVQIRHQSKKAKNPLWSIWSPVIIVPAGLEHKPEVTKTIISGKYTREVVLNWKSMPHAAAVTGVMYSINDTQTLHACPCKEHRHVTNTTNYTINVSHSAVNITVVARNAAGQSPPVIIQVPAATAADLKICDKTLLETKRLKKGTCLELYELQDADLKPENVIILTAKNKKRERTPQKKYMKDYIRYLYFEHRCHNRKPQTVKMCLFYRKEGVPNIKPQDFKVSDETQTSVDLFWKAIPYEHQQGFLTHYNLCKVKISSQNESEECFNISTSATHHHLENLTPASIYNIRLAGVTRVGKGPLASEIVNTLREKPPNVWLSLGLLFIFFLLSIMFTFIMKRIKTKILPPVPTPVIPDFNTSKPDSEEMWERKEEVHEITLHLLLPERKSDSEEATVLKGERDSRTETDMENERSDSEESSDECVSPDSDQVLEKEEMTDLEQVDTELAILIYRNGLVFDEKMIAS